MKCRKEKLIDSIGPNIVSVSSVADAVHSAKLVFLADYTNKGHDIIE